MTAYSIAIGDVAAVLEGFADNSFDALCCDPPYGLSFMGKSWDYDVPSVETWRACLRVLKPGAPLVVFGGSRTCHRLACGIEDAGFELRDQLMWLYGSGFPKSQNIRLAIDKAAGATRSVAVTAPATELAQLWDGWGTALKPAHEPIVLARKPLDGTTAQNVARWGVGGLAIDACRIAANDIRSITRWGQRSEAGGFGMGLSTYVPSDAGRWPANLVLSHSEGCRPTGQAGNPADGYEDIFTCTEDCPIRLLDEQAGNRPSRFFYTSKVSTQEREAGCEGPALRSAGEVTEREDGSDGLDSPRAGAGRTGGARNHHPTLKPISLTTWLARLIMPPRPGVILVPFAGAGSEMIGCLRAGWGGVFGIEREAAYVQIAMARLRHWCPESEAAW